MSAGISFMGIGLIVLVIAIVVAVAIVYGGKK